MINTLTIELSKAAVQILTGNIFSDEQIRLISKNVVGAYLEDWLPTPKEVVESKQRVELARLHITEASQIISSLQGDLDNQAQQLDKIIKDIEEKRKIADHYSTLAETNEKAFEAFKVEMEKAIRMQLQSETEKGKKARKVVSFIVWFITLILGAALGAYFIPLVEFIKNLLKV
jgi:hypothetical protein